MLNPRQVREQFVRMMIRSSAEPAPHGPRRIAVPFLVEQIDRSHRQLTGVELSLSVTAIAVPCTSTNPLESSH